MDNSIERATSELYARLDNLEKNRQKLSDLAEQTSLRLEGLSAILAGLSFSKDIGVETLLSALTSVSFSIDDVIKEIDEKLCS